MPKSFAHIFLLLLLKKSDFYFIRTLLTGLNSEHKHKDECQAETLKTFETETPRAKRINSYLLCFWTSSFLFLFTLKDIQSMHQTNIQSSFWLFMVIFCFLFSVSVSFINSLFSVPVFCFCIINPLSFDVSHEIYIEAIIMVCVQGRTLRWLILLFIPTSHQAATVHL